MPSLIHACHQQRVSPRGDRSGAAACFDFVRARAAGYYGRGAGSGLHVRRVLIDMAESPSTRRAAPADRQDPTLGIKKKKKKVEKNAQSCLSGDYFITAR